MELKNYKPTETEMNNYITILLLNTSLKNIKTKHFRVQLQYLLKIIEKDNKIDELFDYIDTLMNDEYIDDIDDLYSLLHAFPECDFDCHETIMHVMLKKIN